MAKTTKKTHSVEFVGQANSKRFATYSDMRGYIAKAVKSRLAYIIADHEGAKPLWLSITCTESNRDICNVTISWQYPGDKEVRRVQPVSYIDHCGQLGFNPKTLQK